MPPPSPWGTAVRGSWGPARRLAFCWAPLSAFDAVLNRKDPPFDMEYVYTTYLLEHAQRAGARVFNDPRAVRECLLQDPALHEAVGGGLLELQVAATPEAEFRRQSHSGKTPLVMDLRRCTPSPL